MKCVRCLQKIRSGTRMLLEQAKGRDGMDFHKEIPLPAKQWGMAYGTGYS